MESHGIAPQHCPNVPSARPLGLWTTGASQTPTPPLWRGECNLAVAGGMWPVRDALARLDEEVDLSRCIGCSWLLDLDRGAATARIRCDVEDVEAWPSDLVWRDDRVD